MLLLEIEQQVVPEQLAKLVLRSSGGPVGSFLACPLALCTMARDAQVGQEGVGEADQMQGCNCRPIGTILVLAEPQQLLEVFHPLLDRPAPIICLDEPGGRQLRVVGHEPEDLPRTSLAREDDMEDTE